MDQPPEDAVESRIESFVDEEAHELEEWLWLWDGDHTFPVVTHRPGLLGRLSLAFKRAFRHRVRASTADLWDRQRVFNKALIKHLGLRR